MPYRAVPLITGSYYHVYNRTGHSLKPFNGKRCAIEFTKAITYYSQVEPPVKLSQRDKVKHSVRDDYKNILVDVLAYCIMPNHFHLLLKQNIDNGISIYLQRIQNSISHYYNIQNNEKGGLFQGRFKSVLIESENQLLHVSRYIHLNPTSAKLVSSPLEYPYSSLHFYVNNTFQPPFKGDDIVRNGQSADKYLEFVNDNIVYQTELQQIKHMLIDEEL